MNGLLAKTLRDNWYLVGVMVVVIVAAAVGYARSGSTPISVEVEQHMTAAKEEASAKAPVAALVTEDSNVQNVLESYRSRYEGDPKGEEAPALLAAMGNLYRQKQGDYREAAQCFERLISDHPDSPGIRDAYLQLVTCYERLGDEENRRRILRKMVELYPSESQENAYASSLLYR